MIPIGEKETPRLETPGNIGILVLDGSVIEDLERLHCDEQFQSYDLLGDVVQQLVDDGDKVAAYLTDAFWYDVGSVEKYDKLSNEKLSEELGFII